MKPSEILEKAAKLVERGRVGTGCPAISLAANLHLALDGASWHRVDSAISADKYFQLFKPKGAKVWWFGDTWNPKNRDRRVIALSMAAAIARSEGN
jgi:hypothetical protein